MKRVHTQISCFVVAIIAMIVMYINPPELTFVSIIFLMLLAGFGMVWGILGFFIVKDDEETITNGD